MHFYRCILRPEWSVEVVVGGQQYTMWFPFWLWESPVLPVNGDPGRWSIAFSNA